MDYGEKFAQVMAQAIEREESELRDLRAKRRHPAPYTLDTVQKYGELWFWPLFLKEALRDLDFPEVGGAS